MVCSGRCGISGNIWIAFRCKQSSFRMYDVSQPPILQPQLMVPNKKLAKQSWPDSRGSWVLKFMFYYFLLSFPGLSTAPKKYWTKVVQPCFDDVSSRQVLIFIPKDLWVDPWCARNLCDSIERSETTKRRTLAILFTQYFGTIFFSGLPCIGEVCGSSSFNVA